MTSSTSSSCDTNVQNVYTFNCKKKCYAGYWTLGGSVITISRTSAHNSACKDEATLTLTLLIKLVSHGSNWESALPLI